MVKEKRKIGSYYTPPEICYLMVDYSLFLQKKKEISILEPSFGDGRFLRILNALNEDRFLDIDAIEINEDAWEEKTIRPKNSCEKVKINLHLSDYLDFHFRCSKRYDLIIGNPPFVRKKFLSEEQLEKSERIMQINPFYDGKSIKNIWSVFLVSLVSKLQENGVLSLILPTELLQVGFSSSIRSFLESEFDKIEVFTFDKLLFKGEGAFSQDVLMLTCQKNSITKGVAFRKFGEYPLKANVSQCLPKSKPKDKLLKWNYGVLESDEIALLDKLKSSLPSIGDLVKTRPGIVTGANNYFILNKQEIEANDLLFCYMPILLKGSYFENGLNFKEQDYQSIEEEGLPCKLLTFENYEFSKQPLAIQKYLQKGVSEGVCQRYKCKVRKNWYSINLSKEVGEAIFFRRNNGVPKLIKNQMGIQVTDNAYVIKPNDNVDIDSFITSFYNIITMIFSDLYGRFYGGGVLELTPNEFKNLPIPYSKHDVIYFNYLDECFSKEKDLNFEKLVMENSKRILLKKKGLLVDEKDFSLLIQIWKKIMAHRKMRR